MIVSTAHGNIPSPDEEVESVILRIEAAASSSATLEEALESAWLEVRTYLEQMNPYDFQDLIAALLPSDGLPRWGGYRPPARTVAWTSLRIPTHSVHQALG